MTTFRVAGAKLPVSNNIPENERQITAVIEQAAADGVHRRRNDEGVGAVGRVVGHQSDGVHTRILVVVERCEIIVGAAVAKVPQVVGGVLQMCCVYRYLRQLWECK